MDESTNPAINDLYPNLSETELRAAEANLESYLVLVLRIFERMEVESFPQVGTLTASQGTLPCTPPQS